MQIKPQVIPEIKVGDKVSKFIVALARMNPQLQSLSFTIYSPLPGVHERIVDLRSKPAAEIISNFLYDDSHTNKRWQVSASDITSQIINEVYLPRRGSQVHSDDGLQTGPERE
jgi:hypothetical protein